ncbi:uncharacterized protein LOC132626919 [Lycium barbarum]|uniref:uncharacterized protein LOC132626919 n=1 Tax=Lycium barbarum TaxID=112863 RepID=UPI00293E4CE7|nr:uncharacterized protein LOC132626919 [Lycium barbarum]XP_060197932.1 uncharacterized protein LOC132626919 [Lycium barbarum]XP_060197933.1 uncharacterized protein LOC132626919 [Lycium barbarum]XP_060197935.1 uncharacterized protein LOC132626919 [Lycium barbarum]XP_060197936.1 uncharacterized protein LOC132626919 [Lycium barbarum]XP_060197937.1 uncharacterized protein LOC132626919 [Lycium barbarum]XP_060197938.1 uncharacterized protein LOC132626919 [Lycium barbarum]XP_060197939.1 uncharacte
MKEALNGQDPLKIPEGKYYLVDAGLMLRSGLITPYQGERYHLKEYSRNPPRNARELFNLRHASLRNAIERVFGVLKKRFPIISSSTESSYCTDTQKLIIFACCILLHYLRGVDPNDELLAQVDAEHMNDNDVHEELPNHPRESTEEYRRGELIHNRMRVIKTKFAKCYDTFQMGMSGFSWDPITNMWDAEPEVWDQLIQAKPAAAELRTMSIRNYDKLIILYGKDRATGKHAETGPDMLKRGARKNLKRSSTSSLTIDEVDEMILVNAASLENTEEHGQDKQNQPTNGEPTSKHRLLPEIRSLNIIILTKWMTC